MFKKLKGRKQEAKGKKYINCILLFLVLILPFVTNAQCAMCRAALEGEGNTSKAKAVNDGIVYLMVIPYLLVGIIGFIIYRMWKNKKV
jgi:hypothetical protein